MRPPIYMSLPEINSHLILQNKSDGDKLAATLKRFLCKSGCTPIQVECRVVENATPSIGIYLDSVNWRLLQIMADIGAAVMSSGLVVFSRVDKLPPEVLEQAGFNLLHVHATEVKESEYYFTMADGSLKTVRKAFRDLYPEKDASVKIDILI